MAFLVMHMKNIFDIYMFWFYLYGYSTQMCVLAAWFDFIVCPFHILVTPKVL